MADVLTMSEIRSLYDNEWVLIEDPDTDEQLEVRGGKVLFHSRDRDEFDQTVRGIRTSRFAVVYTGPVPSEGELLL